jgi:nucleotide-binding universal stress UspA family protein
MGFAQRPIVCGVDDSPEARAAARSAAALAAGLDVPLVLAHIARVPAANATPATAGAPFGHALPYDADDLEDRAREEGLRLLDTVAAELPTGASLELRSGDPAHGLERVIDELDAQLLAVGAHGRSALARAVRGTLWCRLSASVPCPVSITGPEAVAPGDGPVIVGYDGSDHAARALSVGRRLAARLGRDLLPIQVVERGSGAPLESVAKVRDLVVLQGDPAGQILAAAREERAVAVLTGSRGRGPWRTAVLGSFSATLVETASSPVMVVPQRAH